MSEPKTRSRYVVLTLEFKEDEELGGWEGVCRELGTATSGDTFKEVFEELQDLIKLHLEGLEQDKQLEKVFHERGIKFHLSSEDIQEVKLATGVLVQRKVVKIPQAAECV